MNQLLTAVAVISLSTTLVAPVSAATDGVSMTFVQAAAADDVRASHLLGRTIYSADIDLTGLVETQAAQVLDWDAIGEVEDVIMDRDGNVKAVVLGVGGILDIGDKSVAIDMGSLRFVTDSSEEGNFFLAVNGTEEQLTNAPEYQYPKDPDLTASLSVPRVNYDGYTHTEISQLTAEQLKGTRVYGRNNEDVGEIDRLLLTNDGKLDKAVVDVGGFLGMGEHSVAVAFDRLTILRQDGGDDVRVYIDSTENKLERLPAYED